MNYQNLNVSQFAKLANTTVRTIKYYEERGLLFPDHIDENGYRKYSIYQLDDFLTITTLQDTGMSLEEIKEYLENPSMKKTYSNLLLQERLLDEKMTKLNQQKEMIVLQRKMLDHYTETGENQIYIRPATLKRYYRDTAFIKPVKGDSYLILKTLLDDQIHGLEFSKEGESMYVYHVPLHKQKDKGEKVEIAGDMELGIYANGPMVEAVKENALKEKLLVYAKENGYEMTNNFLCEVIYEDKDNLIINLKGFVKKK